ncbi:MAG: DUF4350 domain-containing protein [Candidatus Odinarchaeota archaeon]
MNRIRIGLITVVMLTLFLSPVLLVGGNLAPTNSRVQGNERLASLADDVYGQSRRNDPVSILVYTQFADLSTGGEYDHMMSAIDAEYGTSYHYSNLTDYHGLASVINEFDILLIPEQENAYVSNMTAVGNAWSTILNGYITDGGIVITMDYYGPLNAPADAFGITSRILNASGLVTVTGFYDRYSDPMDVHEYDDALALGVASTFVTPDGAIGYVTSDGVDVVGDALSSMVVHKVIGKGHLVLLGFDFYSTEINCIKMLGNSIRLHHHVVVDASHGQDYHVPVELSDFAILLASQGFAVSTMSTFDPALLAACDVLVITYCSILYNTTEVNQIEDFVNNGGGLFVAQEWSSFGNEMDPVTERFGYVRNKTSYLTDSDDYSVNQWWVILDSENTHNHSATIVATELEIYAGTAFIQVPESAYPLYTADNDGTATFAGIPANDAVISAASTHQKGRVIVVGDGSFLVGTADSDSDGTVNIEEANNGYFAMNAVRWLLAAGIEEKMVLFDESHSPYGTVEGANLDFAYFLTLNGYTVHWMTAFYEQLVLQADVLFVMSGSSTYNSNEIDPIVDFVANGKSLFIIGDWGMYGNESASIGSEFGLELNTTQSYLDDTDNWLVFPSLLVYNTSHFANHPIMTGVDRIEIDRGTGFASIGAGTPLIHTDTDGTAFWRNQTISYKGPANGVTVFASTTFNKGRVVFLTDVNFVQGGDPDSDGVIQLYDSDNDRLISNAFFWLVENRAPTVHLTFPNGGETLNGTQVITWTAVDFDNDVLSYDVFYSTNNGTDWLTLALDLSIPEYAWNTTAFSDGSGYMIRVIASDGQATGQDQSDGAFELDNFISDGGLPLDPMLLLLIGAGVIIVVIVIVIIMKKGGGGKK